jgi:hypothetical protein
MGSIFLAITQPVAEKKEPHRRRPDRYGLSGTNRRSTMRIAIAAVACLLTLRALAEPISTADVTVTDGTQPIIQVAV